MSLGRYASQEAREGAMRAGRAPQAVFQLHLCPKSRWRVRFPAMQPDELKKETGGTLLGVYHALGIRLFERSSRAPWDPIPKRIARPNSKPDRLTC